MLVMVFIIIIIIIFLVIVFIIIIIMFDGNQEQSYSLVETRYLKRIYNTPRMCVSSDFGMNQDTPRGKAKNVPILICR